MKKLKHIHLLWLLLPALLLVSCGKDEPEPEVIIPNPDGFYVYGTNTIADSPKDLAAKMALALLDPAKSGGNENLDGVYAKLMYVGANSTLSFLLSENQVETTYGAPNGGEIITASDLGDNDIHASIIHGVLTADADPIQITDEGLYYVYVDMNTSDVRVMKLEPQMIGDATVLQWTAGTPIPQVFVSADSAVFEVTGLQLAGASGYKYRFSNGWELFNNGTFAVFTNLGVESYGTAWDTGINDIGYFTENIPHKEDGMFTVRLKFDAATGAWSETKTKTGSVLLDYTYTEMSIFGNAYKLPSGDTANWGSGTDGYGLHVPVKDGNVYTWTWRAVELIQDREFILLENGAWGGLQLDWSMLTSVGGTSVDDGKIVDATTQGGEYHNFMVLEGAAYTVELVIDAAAETKTVSITPVAK